MRIRQQLATLKLDWDAPLGDLEAPFAEPLEVRATLALDLAHNLAPQRDLGSKSKSMIKSRKTNSSLIQCQRDQGRGANFLKKLRTSRPRFPLEQLEA